MAKARKLPVVSQVSTRPHSTAVSNPVKNDLLERTGGTRYRLLQVTDDGQAWIINITDPKCWPVRCPYASLLEAIAADELSIVVSNGNGQHPFHSEQADARRREALKVIEPLIVDPSTFDANLRGALVKARAAETGKSKTTIYRYLQMYWCGGQSQQVLLPKFPHMGSKQSGQTHGRGRTPKGERYKIYPMDPVVDVANVKEAIEKHYLNDKVSTLRHAWLKMLMEKYSYLDGTGNRLLKPSGERPSFRQFRTVSKQSVPILKNPATGVV